MKIRIVSDLHVDVNETLDFGFIEKLDETDVVLIAGDIGGSDRVEYKFFKTINGYQKNTPIIAVAGNHLGYDSEGAIYGKLDEIFMLKGVIWPNQHYLNDEYIEIGDYIIFGGPMYTDFNLYGKDKIATCINTAKIWLNDFRYCQIRDPKVDTPTQIRRLTPEDYIEYFKQFKKSLKKCIKETTKDIIVLTHFAPSKKSISKKYVDQRPTFKNPGYYLNACYASNLDTFIKNNPRIKLWVHGHMHDHFDYNIGQCRVICHPYGYMSETLLQPKKYFGKIIEL